MFRTGIVTLAFVMLLPISAQAAPYTKQSCQAESWYGEQGKWVYVEGWGWGCSHRTSWPLARAVGGPIPSAPRVFESSKGTVQLTPRGLAKGAGTPADARVAAPGGY